MSHFRLRRDLSARWLSIDADWAVASGHQPSDSQGPERQIRWPKILCDALMGQFQFSFNQQFDCREISQNHVGHFEWAHYIVNRRLSKIVLMIREILANVRICWNCACWWLSIALQWRRIEGNGVSNHQSLDCSLNHVFRRWSKKTSTLRVTGLCEGNLPVDSPHKGPVTRKNASIWWRFRVLRKIDDIFSVGISFRGQRYYFSLT